MKKSKPKCGMRCFYLFRKEDVHGMSGTGVVAEGVTFNSIGNVSYTLSGGQDYSGAGNIGGIAVSSGSACTSGSENPSHVLLALGHDVNTAKATLRFSFGRYTTNDDLEDAVKVLSKILLRMTSGKS